MKVTEARYIKRFNIGNYESEEIGLIAAVEDGDDHIEVLTTLKAHVGLAFGGQTKQGEEDERNSTTHKDVSGSDNNNDSDHAGEKHDEVSDVGTSNGSDVEPKNKKSKDKKPKKFKEKSQGYDRENETHKEIFSQVLKSLYPDWKKSDETKAKAKEASQKLAGVPFLDEGGEVLAEFKDAIKKLMAK